MWKVRFKLIVIIFFYMFIILIVFLIRVLVDVIGFMFYWILTKGNGAVEENWSVITRGGGERL